MGISRKVLRWGAVGLLVLGGLFLMGSSATEGEQGDIRLISGNEYLVEDVFFGGAYFENAGTVDGSLYVASDSMLIGGTVNGNVIAAGTDVRISGHVTGDVFVAGQSVSVLGRVDGSVYMAGGTVTVEPAADILRGVYAAGNLVRLYGEIGRDALTASKELVVKGLIAGDLRYSAQNANIVAGSVRGLQIANEMPKEAQSAWNSTTGRIFDGLSFVFTSLIIWALLVFLFKETRVKAGLALRGNLASLFFYKGLLGIIAGGGLAIVLMLSYVGLPFGIMLALLLGIGLYLSSGVFVVVLADRLADRYGKWTGGNNILYVLALAVVLSMVKIIPYLGPFVGSLTLLGGFGLLLGSFFQKDAGDGEKNFIE